MHLNDEREKHNDHKMRVNEELIIYVKRAHLWNDFLFFPLNTIPSLHKSRRNGILACPDATLLKIRMISQKELQKRLE